MHYRIHQPKRDASNPVTLCCASWTACDYADRSSTRAVIPACNQGNRKLRPHNTAVRISRLMRNSALAHMAPADHWPGMPGELVLDLGEQGGDVFLSFPVGGKGFFLVGFPVHAFVFLSGCSVVRQRPASCPITLGRRLKSSG